MGGEGRRCAGSWEAWEAGCMGGWARGGNGPAMYSPLGRAMRGSSGWCIGWKVGQLES